MDKYFYNIFNYLEFKLELSFFLENFCSFYPIMLRYEEFQDTKGAIRIRISKRNRQPNGQKKMYKRTNNDLQNIHIKLKIK